MRLAYRDRDPGSRTRQKVPSSRLDYDRGALVAGSRKQGGKRRSSIALRWLPTLLLGACSSAETGGDVGAKSVPPAHASVDPVVRPTQTAEEIDAPDDASPRSSDAAGDDPIGDPIDDPIDAPIGNRSGHLGDDSSRHTGESGSAQVQTDDSDPSDSAAASSRPTSPEAIATVEAIRRKVGDDDASPIPILDRRKWFRHKLVPRERVAQVAHRYGVTEADLREWNGLSDDTQRMRLGARLRVLTARVPPHREKLEYTVAAGDTWWSVALRHGVDARDVRAYNYPWRGKMTPGSTLLIWTDPIVVDWIRAGGDPLPDDDAFALRRGGIGVGRPDAGWLVNGVRMPKGDGYHLRLPKSAYGTSHAVAQWMIGLAVFADRSDYTRTLEIGAMSRPRGGELKGHRSHQSGRDVDIRLPRRAGVASWVELTRRRIDWLATWQLIDAMLQTDVTAIFLDYAAQKSLFRTAKGAGIDPARLRDVLQYPDGRSAAGIVRHSPGHDKHLHVRVGCGPYDVECVE